MRHNCRSSAAMSGVPSFNVQCARSNANAHSGQRARRPRATPKPQSASKRTRRTARFAPALGCGCNDSMASRNPTISDAVPDSHTVPPQRDRDATTSGAGPSSLMSAFSLVAMNSKKWNPGDGRRAAKIFNTAASAGPGNAAALAACASIASRSSVLESSNATVAQTFDASCARTASALRRASATLPRHHWHNAIADMARTPWPGAPSCKPRNQATATSRRSAFVAWQATFHTCIAATCRNCSVSAAAPGAMAT
mmetsp:Transcript_42103/g.122145  ORF Transcript_42103/g.122145 Transcript_42103/m.122145 type:complete len:254 (+) Transcript_42103:836-1597(+)